MYKRQVSEWTAYGGSSRGERYAGAEQINSANVGRLKKAWEFHTGDLPGEGDPGEITNQVTPLKIGDNLFICTPHSIAIAVDADTGEERWRFDPAINRQAEYYQHMTCRGPVSYAQLDVYKRQVFNQTVQRIHDLSERVGHTVGEVGGQADRVELVSGESNQAVASQRAQIEQVATAMNQMSATAQEVARSAAAAVGSAQSVNQETVSGRALVEQQVGAIQRLAGEIDQSVAVINQLASDSAAISQLLDVIKGSAEQTNLLALNAAIEAARAGEQGRGLSLIHI